MQKHRGTVCHIDFVVRSLYGDLEPDIFKLVKGRVQSTLTYGRESGKWSLVPGKPGSFTLDLKLLNSNRKRLMHNANVIPFAMSFPAPPPKVQAQIP